MHEVCEVFDFEDSMLTGLTATTEPQPTDAGEELRCTDEKSIADMATVAYAQTLFGIPVWGAGFSVRMDTSPLQVVGSQSTVRRDLSVQRPDPDAPYLPGKVDAGSLAGLLSLSDPPRINAQEPFIYRYDPESRQPPAPEPSDSGAAESDEALDFQSPLPRLPLPDVDRSIEPGKDYVVNEVLFTLDTKDFGELNWSAFVEVATGSVLRLYPLVGCASAGPVGSVYLVDPITKTNNASLTPSAGTGALDPHRDEESLPGLNPPAPASDQELTGQFVRMVDLTAPNVAPPTSRPPGDFRFSVGTDDFSAVNAYFHCDRLFRLLEDFGLDVRTYFNGTSFPVRVDHRVQYRNFFGVLTDNIVNASAPGNGTRRGSDGFRFALAQRNTNVGIAADWRVVLHEFGHALLWDHVFSPNFGFAHSAGDSLAAILNDPESARTGTDRFDTFPWTPISRRHDRRPDQGWGFGDPANDAFTGSDPAGYRAEEVLSSTMFRIYRAAGGDADNLSDRQFAAYYSVFLIIKAIGLLSPFDRADEAEDFADALMQADSGTFLFEGDRYPCGVLDKVIRWGFEQQGAYQPPGRLPPIDSPGDPPEVDVYIDDGRAGQYEYQSHLSEVPDIWVRNASDGLLDHQSPVIGSQNFIYVRLKNRGTQGATSNVRVNAYKSDVEAEHIWPTDWRPLTTPHLTIPAGVPSGGEVVVGPFPWTPVANGEHILMVATADGDPSNADDFTSANPVPNKRLVPLDNNVAQRQM